MRVYPAIDLLGGKAVRLLKGKRETSKVYSQDPVGLAEGFFGRGAEFVHVVDLDAAFKTGSNFQTASKIAKYGRVELGGGIADAKIAALAAKANVRRIVVGTALFDQDKMGEIRSAFKGEVFAALDFSADGKVLTGGWNTKRDFPQTVPKVDGLIATSADRDGTLAGPDTGLFDKVRSLAKVRGYAGGIGDETDLEVLEKQGWDFAVVGKAFYEEKIGIEKLKEWF